ncbi:MAG: hypothetical protein ACRD8O_01085, partial [Bryobacteraceae bacterium]
LRRNVLDPKIDELLHLLGLWEDRHSLLASYSKGMRQRILLSSALFHGPELQSSRASFHDSGKRESSE